MDCHQYCPKLPWMIDFNSNETKDVLNNQYEAAFSNNKIEYMTKLNIRSQPARFRSTQIVCTITSNVSLASIDELLANGMRVARLVAPTIEKLKEILSRVRTMVDIYSRRIGRVYPLAIGLDLRGPEIRTGSLKSNSKQIFLEKGKETKLTTKPEFEEFVNEDMIFVDYEKLPEVIQPGDKLIFDQGSVTLSALECVESIVRCIVEKAGNLFSNDSVTIPNATIDLPTISASDKQLMEMAVGECVEYLFACGIQNKQGIYDIRNLLGPRGETILIVVKVENENCVENIDEIIKFSDGILIDCDRLILELPKEKVFLIQKSIIAKCNLAGKPVISTISFANSNVISKSEIVDITSAILDGSDALLLPKNANNGKIMKLLDTICKEAEPAVHQRQLFNDLVNHFPAPMEAVYSLAISVVEAASNSSAAAIVCLSTSGRTAKIISRFKPRCPIIVVTRYPRVSRQLCVFRGVEPLIYLRSFCGEWNRDVDNRIQLGVTYGKLIGYIRMGDAVVTVNPSRPECGMANCLKVIYASEFDTLNAQQMRKSKQT
ncbi:pyruvate kinase-like [Diorhabda sublineata]|uniref:pyruvate kinase-like n=1 Tax=Diorhabda sublineata TaxID=1163346 RepID=UPI0024E06F99|nr:pyruvate kinase-like [Diorhabda sublineata]